MANVKISSVLNALKVYRSNPAMMVGSIFKALNKASGIKIVDATSPLAWAVEQSVMTTVTAIDSFNSTLRKMSPELSNTIEDLYPHLSEVDRKNINASPASCTIFLILSKKEVLEKMVAVTNTGNKRLTIPANTEFSVSDYTLSMQYPIDITYYPTGSTIMQYGTPSVSALNNITTNEIEWEEFRSTDGMWYYKIPILVWQLTTIEKEIPVSFSSGLRSDIALYDKFHTARVFNYSDTLQSWSEIATSGSVYHFDPLVATAIVQNLTTKVRVNVPINYMTNKMIGSKLKTIIYQTMGDVTPSLSSFRPTEWSYNWKTLNPDGFTTYEAGCMSLTTAIIYSDDVLSGGTDPLTFTQVRQQVIARNLGTVDDAITQSQLTTALDRLGFKLVKKVDTITNRSYLAVRKLPDPIDDTVTTSICASMVIFSSTISQAINAYGVNQQEPGKVAITSAATYMVTDGVYNLITTEQKEFLDSLSPRTLASYINTNQHAFSPFDYVLTADTKSPTVKAYYLDKPKVTTKSYLEDNVNSTFNVATSQNYTITRQSDGFLLEFYTNSSDNFKSLDDSNIDVCLSFIPPGKTDRSFIRGTLVARTATSERKYQILFKTKSYIDPTYDRLYLNDVYSLGELSTEKVDLTTTFDLVYCMKKSAATFNPSTFEDLVDRYRLGINYTALSHETFRISFGQSLNNLWLRHRSVVNERQYLRYTSNVYETYSQNIYHRSSGLPFRIIDGALVWNNIVGHAGAFVLDENDNKIIKHRTGEIICDTDGVPQINPESVNELVRQISIFMVDGFYRFVTDEDTLSYYQYAIDTVVNWITDDIADINKITLEKTRIFFHPKNEHGSVKILAPSGKTTHIDSEQVFTVDVYVNKSTYDDKDLKSLIGDKITEIIKTNITTDTPSVNDIIQNIKVDVGDDIVDLKMTGFAGDKYPVIGIIDDHDKISLAKKLYAQSDGVITIVDSITINYILFDKNK